MPGELEICRRKQSTYPFGIINLPSNEVVPEHCNSEETVNKPKLVQKKGKTMRMLRLLRRRLGLARQGMGAGRGLRGGRARRLIGGRARRLLGAGACGLGRGGAGGFGAGGGGAARGLRRGGARAFGRGGRGFGGGGGGFGGARGGGLRGEGARRFGGGRGRRLLGRGFDSPTARDKTEEAQQRSSPRSASAHAKEKE